MKAHLLLLVVAVEAGGAAVLVAIRPFGAEDNCIKTNEKERYRF